MWINERFDVSGTMSWLKQFVNENTLSTIVSHDPVCVAHMPVELIDVESEDPRLIVHIPTVDPIVNALTDGGVVTVVVHGPQQYISPSVYHEVGLPTFNYGIAEVTGRCRSLTQNELTGHLERLMVQREAMFAEATGLSPWILDEEAKARFELLLPRVAGFEVSLKSTQLKLKVGQNRTREDRQHTVQKLRNVEGVDPQVLKLMHGTL